MDLALNNKGWYAIKPNQPTNQPTNQPKSLSMDKMRNKVIF